MLDKIITSTIEDLAFKDLLANKWPPPEPARFVRGTTEGKGQKLPLYSQHRVAKIPTLNETIFLQINQLKNEYQRDTTLRNAQELSGLLNKKIVDALNNSPNLAVQLFSQNETYLNSFKEMNPSKQLAALNELALPPRKPKPTQSH